MHIEKQEQKCRMHLRNTAHKSKIYPITLLRFRVRKWRCKQHPRLGAVPAWAVLGGRGWAAAPTLGRRCWNGALKLCRSMVEGCLLQSPAWPCWMWVCRHWPPAPSCSPSLHLWGGSVLMHVPLTLMPEKVSVGDNGEQPLKKAESNLTHRDCLKRAPQSPAALYRVPD